MNSAPAPDKNKKESKLSGNGSTMRVTNPRAAENMECTVVDHLVSFFPEGNLLTHTFFIQYMKPSETLRQSEQCMEAKRTNLFTPVTIRWAPRSLVFQPRPIPSPRAALLLLSTFKCIDNFTFIILTKFRQNVRYRRNIFI